MALGAVWRCLLAWNVALSLLFSSWLGHHLAAQHDPEAFLQKVS